MAVSSISSARILERKDFRQWISDIWRKILLGRFPDQLSEFKELDIFPINYSCTTDNLVTAKLNSILLLKCEIGDEKADSEFTAAFKKMGVKRIAQIPGWMDRAEVKQFLYHETPNDLIRLLENLSEARINDFNRNATVSEKHLILNYFSTMKLEFSEKSKKKLAILTVFHVYKSSGSKPFSWAAVSCFPNIYIGNEFPIEFPFPLMKVNSEAERDLALKLGAKIFDDQELILATLEKIDLYEKPKVKFLMLWILKTPYLKDLKILEKVSEVPFLDNERGQEFRPCDLFDPYNDLLLKLFKKEPVFPIKTLCSDEVEVLKKLGLKQEKDVTKHDIRNTIDLLAHMPIDVAQDKGHALLEYMNKNPSLAECFKDKAWIFPSSIKNYPASLPMLNRDSVKCCCPAKVKSSEFVHCIGSVSFVLDCSHLQALTRVFAWATPPPVDQILRHLLNVISHYKKKHKVEFLPMIMNIYEKLAKHGTDQSEELRDAWNRTFSTEQNCIWTGDKFSPRSSVYLEHEADDLQLVPYMFHLPQELQSFKSLFVTIDCVRKLDCLTYARTLEKIKVDSDAGRVHPTMMNTTVSILNKLKNDYLHCIKEPEIQSSLYFPVSTEDQKTFSLKHVSKCMFLSAADGNWQYHSGNADDLFYIHPEVPPTTAQALGVRTLQQQMLSDVDAFEEWGQEEPLTRRIATLLQEGYVDGFSVAKELFQNADDAGASKLYILYDERKNESHRQLLINDGLAEWQGPAIWVFNDAKFSECDFQNITKLNGATKADDARKIGKFGLGFCAVYNITDVPSFASAESFVIFDPHTTFIGNALPGKNPGLRLNLQKTRNLMSRLQHQFQVFQNVFGFKLEKSYFDGTLFRLPLRSRGSEICQKVYTHDEVVKLLQKFSDMASNMFIFNQNVSELKIYHLLEDDPSEMKEMYCVRKELVFSSDIHLSIVVEAVGRKNKQELSSNPLRFVQEMKITSKQIANNCLGLPQTNKSCSWLISWATGSKHKTLDFSAREAKLIPLGSVATPVEQSENSARWKWKPLNHATDDFYHDGHFYCYLPLPVTHGFRFHINSQFDVTSDRRSLRYRNEDEKQSDAGEWNECLMGDVIVKALLYLLENATGNQIKNMYILWPTEPKTPLEDILCKYFYEHITSEEIHYNIFPKDGGYFSFTDVIFLESELRSHRHVGEIAFKFMCHFAQKEGKQLIDIPSNILSLLMSAAPEKVRHKTVSSKQFITNYFLPNIEHFGDTLEIQNDRDLMTAFVLKFDDPDVRDSLKCCFCIPVLPNGCLKKPGQLIDPEASFSTLFRTEEGFFPHRNFTSDKTLIDVLKKLGMMSEFLPHDFVVDRARTIADYNEKCTYCSMRQCKGLLQYLSTVERGELALFSTLRDIDFLPVRMKPSWWIFPWKGDKLVSEAKSNLCSDHTEERKSHVVLSRPRNLFLQKYLNVLGCVSLILDQEILGGDKTTFKKIGVQCLDNNKTGASMVLQQFVIMVENFHLHGCPAKPEKLSKIVHDVYKFLDHACKDETLKGKVRSELTKRNVVWVGHSFSSVSRIARYHTFNCQPYLFKLEDSPLHLFRFLSEALQIQDNFTHATLKGQLSQVYQAKSGQPLDKDELRQCIELLRCYVYLKKDVKEQGIGIPETVYAPADDLILRCSTELCFNDCDEIEKTETMNYLHGEVPPNVAKVIGVKKKHIQFFEDNSDDIVDFYQEEPLVIRLRRLVENYPCDIGIFKEMIQNADDAGATEIHFLLDKAIHPSRQILHESMEPLQNQALCVFNNQPFTEKDLKGIQKLGQGGKDGDPSKTGKYGVGFNSVYNLTDAPSFLTKGDEHYRETLCLFDPLAQYIPQVTKKKPGKRVKNVESLRKVNGDTLKGYHEDRYFVSGKGTMFRLPLRSKSSEIKKDPVTTQQIEDLLDEFVQEVSAILLFLRNINKICVTEFINGKYVDKAVVVAEYSVRDSVKKRRFTELMETFCKSCKDSNEAILTSKQTVMSYKIRVKQALGQNITEAHYYVVQAFGFSSEMEYFLKKQIEAGKMKLIPHGGVAYRLSDGGTSTDGKVYCFLPLDNNSGLPVSVNGQFVLSHESRRELWFANKEKCRRRLWNEALVKSVISDAYISLIDIMKEKYTGRYSDSRHPFESVCQALESFEKVFPVKDSVAGHYWSILTQSVYLKLVKSEKKFLPTVSRDVHVDRFRNKICLCSLSWTTLYGQRFSAYYSDESDKPNDKSYFRNSVLRFCGLRIVRIGKKIRDSMDYFEVPIEEISPKHVIDFLCSHGAEHLDKCLIKTDSELKDTVLQNIGNVEVLLNYIIEDEKHFQENVLKIPLVVTEDMTLRCLQDGNPIFVTKFVDFFLQEKPRFLHRKLVSLIGKGMKSSHGQLRNFELKDFIQLVERNGPVKMKQTHYVDLDVNNSFLKKFWMFFTHCMNQRLRDSKHGAEIIKTMISEIKDLSIIMLNDPVDNFPRLCNTAQLYTLIDLENFKSLSRNLFLILGKMKLPTLDKTPMLRESVGWQQGCEQDELVRLFRTHVPNYGTPEMLLKCFIHHKERFCNAELETEEAQSVLEYFNHKLKPGLILATDLKSLPLFETVDGVRRSLKDFSQVCVIHRNFPLCGLKGIIESADVALIFEDPRFQNLYNHLGCSKMTLAELYLSLIIPKHQTMTRVDFYTHINFLAGTTEELGEHTNEIRNILRRTAFVETSTGSMVRIEHLFDHDIPLFTLMCQSDELLPEQMRNNTTCVFLRGLGLRTEMNLELFYRFAMAVEQECHREGLQDVTRKKSNILVDSLVKMPCAFFQQNTFDDLASIHFVLPLNLDKTLQRIFPQYKSETLICFKGSVPPSEVHISWTTCNVLAKKAFPSNEMVREKLFIHTRPSFIDWERHVRNIGDALQNKILKDQANGSDESNQTVETVLERIYESVRHYEKENNFGDKMRCVPLIHFPEKNIVVSAKNVINNCTEEEQEIPPYLMKSPVRYGKYFDQFLSLGAHRMFNCAVIAQVLKEIKDRSRDNTVLLPKEEVDAQKAMSLLFKQLTAKEWEVNIPDDKLFLLCTMSNEHTEESVISLEDSRTLVVNNNNSLKKRVSKGRVKLKFVMDMKSVGSSNEMIDCIQFIPDNMRPHFLTDIVEERVDLSCISPCEGYCGLEIERYIHSGDFLQSFLRLAKHCRKEAGKEWNSDTETEICEVVRRIHLRNVKGISTFLKVFSLPTTGTKKDAQNLPETSEPKSVHIADDDSQIFVYFEAERNWQLDIREKMCLFLNERCQLKLGGRLSFLLTKIMAPEYTYQELSEMLDKESVGVYESSISVGESLLPKPGTFVPKKLHKFLDNDYGLIQAYDYKFIAYLISDDDLPPLHGDSDNNHKDDDDENEEGGQTYIYVHIVQKLSETSSKPLMFQEYLVDTGEESPRVIPAYLLFKFIRKPRHQSANEKRLVLFKGNTSDTENQASTLSIMDICAEIRNTLIDAWEKDEQERRKIIKRLWLKWHPDKNPDRVDVATKVFQYLQQCIELLQKGKIPPHYEKKGQAFSDGDTSGFSHGYSSGGGFFSSSWFRRSQHRWRNKTYGEYYDFDAPQTDHEPEPYHFYSEARRWQEQAEFDVKDARSSLHDDGEHTNNLICYKAHQVRKEYFISKFCLIKGFVFIFLSKNIICF